MGHSFTDTADIAGLNAASVACFIDFAPITAERILKYLHTLKKLDGKEPDASVYNFILF